MSDHNIRNSQTSTRKPRKASAKTVESSVANPIEDAVVEKSPIPEKHVAQPSGGKKFVFFCSGAGYVTRSGFKFSPQNRIYEVDEEEANHLLSLSNFRLPNQLELEDYYKENN